LKHRRVRFTATAQQHVEREKAWWLKNRDHTEVFVEELERALSIVAVLYYTFDNEEVTIRALWGARRKRGPELKG